MLVNSKYIKVAKQILIGFLLNPTELTPLKLLPGVNVFQQLCMKPTVGIAAPLM